MKRVLTGQSALIWALALALAALAFLVGQFAPSRDLLALWLAGDAVAAGNPAGIYPPLDAVFTMRPPMAWFDRAAQLGHPGEVYPYIYAPIWAWLVAPLTALLDFQTFKSLFFVLNAACLGGTVVIAARMAGINAATPAEALSRPQMRNWLALAGFVFVVSMAGWIALEQNQLQVVVAFLCVFALHRAETGRPVAAGLAMGLAIALKLSPLPLALIWLLIGQRRALVVAMIAGGALGLASVVIAGWPLHADFLALLRMIDHTILVSTITFSLDTVLAALPGVDTGEWIPALPPGVDDPAIASAMDDATSVWIVLAKPALLASLSKIGLLATLAGSALLLRRATTAHGRAALWAAALTGLAFFAPIGWVYYYIAPFAFAPLIALHFGRAGLLGLLLGSVALVPATGAALRRALGMDAGQLIGLIILVYLAALLAVARSAERDA